MKSDEPFEQTLVPRCDGQAVPAPDDTSARARMKREFAAVYHGINVLSRKLASVRATPGSPERLATEREVLQEIEKALLARDALDDGHASTGIIASPVFERGVVTDIYFTMPGQRPGAASATSLCFTVTPAPSLIPPGA
jgi:hypothetical protein